MVNFGRSQRGVTLLLFLFLALVIGATIFLSGWNANYTRQEQEKKSQLALQQAKDGLIGSAAAYRMSSGIPRPGHLRCPEILSPGSPNEGQTQNSCSSSSSRLGRFPWKSYGTERLVDGYGEPLWYAISSGFDSAPINSTTPGQLQLDGLTTAAVAVIIAPGPALSGQNRSSPSASNPPQVSDYLDLGNAGGTNFVSNGPASSFNDRVIRITQADLFNAVNARVLAEIRGLDESPNLPSYGLRGYFKDNGQFPWAALPGGGSAIALKQTGGLPFNDLLFDLTTFGWLTANNWFPLITYTRISANSAQISIGGRVMKILPCTTLPCP